MNSTRLLRQIRQLTILLLTAALFTASVLQAQSSRAETVERLKKHVEYLASDEMEGRAPGSEGNQKAANFLANLFKEYGLKPLGDDYFQEFTVTTKVQLAEGNSAVLRHNGEEYNWETGVQYIPLAFSESASAKGELIFAGYGISAADEGYDDYQDLDVKDKFVIVFRGSPDSDNPHGKLANFAPLHHKVRTAKEKGAVGIIYVSPSDMKDELLKLAMPRGGKNAGIVAVHAKREAVEKLLPEGRTLSDIEAEIKKEMKPVCFALPGWQAEISVTLEFVEAATWNVIGYTPGTDPALADQYIIVGAHYDHLGWGGANSRYEGSDPKIHYGADDNASGTAAMLETARRIAAAPLPRPVIFMGFSAEEMGAIGSNYYCKNPLVPLEETVLMYNMDMVGRMEDNKLNVTGVGTSSTWDSLVDSLGAAFELKISKTADGLGPSDHASFYTQNIPVLNLFTGLHDDYHKPSDTVDKINFGGMATIVDFAEATLRTIGDYAERPDFVKVKTSERQGQRMSFRVAVGTIPDYSDHPKGMRITGVKEGSPAEKAGLQGGDVIIRFGEVEVANIYDYTYALGKYKPGDVVDVVVLRGENEDQQVTLKVHLEARN